MTRKGITYLTVPAAQGPVGLAEFLARTAPDHLKPHLTRILARGGVWLQQRRVFDPLTVLNPGDTLILCAPLNNHFLDATVEPQQIVYEDEVLLALNKPADWYSQGPAWDAFAGADAALQSYLSHRDGRMPTLHLFHRLDRGTSGILLFTKDPRANAPLQKAWPEIEKRYQAIAKGLLGQPAEVHEPVAGKRAHTRINPVQALKQATWVEAWPLTGRTHQIRRHLAHIGHPLVGDERYGGGSGHFYLHASHLSLPHPLLNARLDLAAPLPRPFEEALRRL